MPERESYKAGAMPLQPPLVPTQAVAVVMELVLVAQAVLVIVIVLVLVLVAARTL